MDLDEMLRVDRYRDMDVQNNFWARYIVLPFLDSFRNKSGKPQPIRTKVGTHTQVKGRQRSWNLGRDRLSGGELGEG